MLLTYMSPRRFLKCFFLYSNIFFQPIWLPRLQWVMSCNWTCHIQLRYDEKKHNKKWQDLTWQVQMKCSSGKHQFAAIWYVMFFKKDTLTVWFSYNNHCSWHTELLSFQCFMFSDTPVVITLWYPVERSMFDSINTCTLMKVNHRFEFKTKMFSHISWNWEKSFSQ